jgi:hypothetical protein
MTMREKRRKNTKIELAIALAHGASIASWARANAVPASTAYRWARQPAVREDVASCRRHLISRALGRMTKHTIGAADIIFKIAKQSDSDAVRLRAARALFSDLLAVSKFSDLEERLLEVEDMLDQPDDAEITSSTG